MPRPKGRRADKEPKPSLRPPWHADANLAAGIVTTGLFFFYGKAWLSNLTFSPFTAVLFVWLVAVMAWCAFGVVRHAEALAHLFGEPYGTLILTLAVTGIEVALIGSIMLNGANNPTLARDAMFAALMIVLNGLVGLVLLLGGLRYREQDYNLQGARAFLVVIVPLAVFSLVLPKYTGSMPDASFTTAQALFFATITTMLYAVFLGIQTVRHKGFFTEPPAHAHSKLGAHVHAPTRSKVYHLVLLIATLLPVILLSKPLAKLVDLGIEESSAPDPLGGILVAILVLSPEGLTSLRAATANELQRAVNVLLGSALATIGLTIPSVLAISLLTGHHVELGLSNVNMILLLLTLFLSALTFGGVRTSVLQGTVHLVLFLAYLAMIFSS